MFRSALAVAIGLTSSIATANNTITIEDIPKVQSVVQTQVSPDGDSVAFTRSVPRELYVDENGSNYSQLFVVNDEGVERPFITGSVSIRSIQWSNDSKTIYFLAKLKDDKFTALYQIPVDGGQAQQVLSLKDTSISSYQLSPNNKQLAILAMPGADNSEKELKKLGFKAEVYELGLKNKQLFVVDLAKADKPLSPTPLNVENYVSDVNWSDNGDKLLVKTQPTALIDDKYTKSMWHLYDIASNQVTLSFKTEGKLGDAELSHDGKYIAILGAEDKHDPATGRLYIADTKTAEITEWLPNFMGHVADIEWSNKRNTLNFIANVGTQSFVGSIKTGSNKYKKLIKEGEFIASSLSISDSDKTLALRGNTAKHPNEVFIVRSKKAQRLTDSNSWLNDKRFAKQETISLKARDGVEIDGVLVYPP